MAEALFQAFNYSSGCHSSHDQMGGASETMLTYALPDVFMAMLHLKRTFIVRIFVLSLTGEFFISFRSVSSTNEKLKLVRLSLMYHPWISCWSTGFYLYGGEHNKNLFFSIHCSARDIRFHLLKCSSIWNKLEESMEFFFFLNL